MCKTQKTIIAISGPTAIGKTSLAIKLASYFNTEIISVDSRQFYKEMQIGTAVPDAEELTAVKHHFIQHKSIHDPYNVGDFEKEAITRIELLFKSKDIIVLVGGSGLYMKAVLDGINEFPEIDDAVRADLQYLLQQEGIEELQKLLKKHDPDYYTKVDLQNPQRLIRALEVCIQSQKPFSFFLQKEKQPRSFKYLHLAIDAPRAIIYERINLRVDRMMQAGLLEEASKLYQWKNLNALQTVGYKELFQYIEGKCTLEFAVAEIKKNTRRYAKRQLTWLRRDEHIQWFDHNAAMEAFIDYITKNLQ
jgi:tRNA dimethylallyltransferase